MPKATENMSYGTMPKRGENQIALSPSLAKKFDNAIDKLIGKRLNVKCNGKEYTLTISGIFNGDYDDFFVSSDIEQELYSSLTGEEVYSVSYDVKRFEDIVAVTQTLSEHNIKSETVAKEVASLQNTFQNLSRLFMIVSTLILAVGLFIGIILIAKLQKSRYRELGLLSALGFSKRYIRQMIVYENILLSLMAAVLNAISIGFACLISYVFKLELITTMSQTIVSIIVTGMIVILISLVASHKLIHTEPAVALRK